MVSINYDPYEITDGIHVIKGTCDVGCMCREEGKFCRWCYGRVMARCLVAWMRVEWPG